MLLELLDERGRLDSLLRLTGDVVDVLLLLLHASHVVLERGHLVTGLGGVVPQELSELGAVLAVLVDTELEVLAELLERLLDEVLLDHLKDLRALEHLAGNVKREVLGVDDALEEAQELGDEVLAGVGDEDTAHVELDVALLLGRLELVERGALRDEDHGLELELALNREVLDSEVILPVVANVLVEGGVLLLGDLLGVTHPERLLFVHKLPLVGHLLDLLSLLLLLLVLVNLLDLLSLLLLL